MNTLYLIGAIVTSIAICDVAFLGLLARHNRAEAEKPTP